MTFCLLYWYSFLVVHWFFEWNDFMCHKQCLRTRDTSDLTQTNTFTWKHLWSGLSGKAGSFMLKVWTSCQEVTALITISPVTFPPILVLWEWWVTQLRARPPDIHASGLITSCCLDVIMCSCVNFAARGFQVLLVCARSITLNEDFLCLHPLASNMAYEFNIADLWYETVCYFG